MMMQLQEDNQRNRNPTAKMIIIILLYLFLTFSSKYSTHASHHGLNISQKIQHPIEQLKLSDLTMIYQLDEIYTGTWQNLNTSSDKTSLGISASQGNFHMSLNKVIVNSRYQKFILALTLTNGEYIDQGTLQLNLALQSANLTSVRPDSQSIALALKESRTMDTSFVFSKLLLAEVQGPISWKGFSLGFTLNEKEELQGSITLSTSEISFVLKVHQHERRLLKLIFFALIIFVVSYTPFVSALSILKGFLQGRQNPTNYSLGTLTIATMWDTVLCMLTFRVAFNDQESLVLFIMPAFMLCLLFTNLEPRIMHTIFERNQPQGIQQRRFCSFNLISYGTLIAIYPILVFTNFNRWLFIGISCLLLPQIYLNAIRGHRPVISSQYYVKFILSRFLIIVLFIIFQFYLRCFPYNVFGLQPDYTLVILCAVLLIVQFGLLNVQTKYGPKILLPKWMLQPVFDYSYQEVQNLEEGAQGDECSICLAPLKMDPPGQQSQDVERPFRLMKTPCKHNYHSSCLMAWMKIKMQCPQCRTLLPPYE